MADIVLSEVSERVATITLNRPDDRNALSREVLRVLPAAMSAADADEGVDVVILTGADPAFCAGLDLKEIGRDGGALRGGNTTGEGTREQRGPFPPMTKPVIGAVNGPAVTGGLEVALACDFLIASERASFADTHGRVGLQPGWGLSVLLPQAVGLRRAREMSATGNFVDAATALAWGLVNHVVAHDDLLPACRKLAADIVSNDQAAVRRMRATYTEGSLVADGEAWEIEGREARAWQGRGIDPAEIERRRQAILERGRSQV